MPKSASPPCADRPRVLSTASCSFTSTPWRLLVQEEPHSITVVVSDYDSGAVLSPPVFLP
jgi:hypothetical protein